MRHIRTLRRLALAGSILALGTGCDKTNEAMARTRAGNERADSASAADSTDISMRPHVLYQVFGQREDPRIVPVATLERGEIRPIVLSQDGWKRFDSLYHQRGAQYTIYHGGRAAGWARVTRPMWDERGRALYTLPRCRHHVPLAGAHVQAPPPVGFLVEHIATDAPLADLASKRRRTGKEAALAQARAIARGLAENAAIEPSTLARLDFRAVTVHAGVNDAPTLALSYIDPTAGVASGGHATHLFAIADRQRDGNYRPTYSKIVQPWHKQTEYRRYVDHADLTGDGVDELILEGWSAGHESYMLILQHRDGLWEEVFKGRPSWCLDR